MSRKNSINGQDIQHRKQPIHFYASSRGSLDDVRNGFCSIDFMTSPLSYVSSPSKYDVKKMSPLKGSKQLTLARSPEQQINVDRVMNSSISSKYTRLSSKIQLLEKNLNRLNGQHQSLKDFFSKSQQLSKCLQVYSSVDNLKQKLQQSKTNKYIQQKRYEARFQIIYEDYLKKFNVLRKQSIFPQFQQIKKINNKIKQSKRQQRVLNFYVENFQKAKKNIRSIDQNATRFLDQIQQNLQKESMSLINKKPVSDMIKSQKQRISNKVELVKVKLGELKCITQYEMYLEKQQFLKKNRPQLNHSKKSLPTFEQSFLNNLELKYLTEQSNFVGLESLDRLSYQLSSIDSDLVKILQKYESQKLTKQNTLKKSNNSQIQNSSNYKKNQVNKYEGQVLSVTEKISHFNHQLTGLKSYLKKSNHKIEKFPQIKQVSINDFRNENQEIMQSVNDLEEKIKLLEENLNFFQQKCLLNKKI